MRLALLLSLVPLVSWAEDGREAALRLLREGNALVGRGSCALALERFQRAKAAYPSSHKIDVNIGTALECLGRTAEATTHFELFLDRVDARHPLFGGVRSKVTALRARVVKVAVSCPGVAPGRVIVDGVQSPLPGRAYAEPGSRRIVLVCGALRRTEEVQLAAGTQREVQMVAPSAAPELRLTAPSPASAATQLATPPLATPPLATSLLPAPPPPTPPPPRTPIYKRWWFWSIVGVAVVGTTVGVVAATTGGNDRMPRGEVGHISID